MISRTENRIKDFLYHDKDFIQTEEIALEAVKEYKDDLEEPDFSDKLTEVYDIIMEQAYLEGYKDGLETKTKEYFKKNIMRELNISELREIMQKMGVKSGQ